jgi:hypothetical protein
MDGKISIPTDAKIKKVTIVPSIKCEKYSAGSLRLFYDDEIYEKDTEETYSMLQEFIGDADIGKSWSLQKYAIGDNKDDDVINQLGKREESTVLSPFIKEYHSGITMDEFKTKIENSYIEFYDNYNYNVPNTPYKTRLTYNSVIIVLEFETDVTVFYSNYFSEIRVFPNQNRLAFYVPCSSMYDDNDAADRCSTENPGSIEYPENYRRSTQGGGSCPGPSRNDIVRNIEATYCSGGRGRGHTCSTYNSEGNRISWYSYQSGKLPVRYKSSGTWVNERIDLNPEVYPHTIYGDKVYFGKKLVGVLNNINHIDSNDILKGIVKIQKNYDVEPTDTDTDSVLKCQNGTPNFEYFTTDSILYTTTVDKYAGWNFDTNKCNYLHTDYTFDGVESKACGDSDLVIQRSWANEELPAIGDPVGSIECVYNIKNADDLKSLENSSSINLQKDANNVSLLEQLQKTFCDRTENENVVYNSAGASCSSLVTSGTPSGGGNANDDCLSGGNPIPYASLTTDALKSECFPAGEPDSSCSDSSIKSKECFPGCYSGDDEISYDELTTAALKDVCYPSGDPGADEGQICTPEDEVKNALLYAYDENGICVVNTCRTGYTKNKDGTKCKKEKDMLLYAIIGIILLFVLILPLAV